MKQQIIDDRFHDHSGVTKMVVNNKYGKFTSYAVCDQEDYDIKSGWVGIDICQLDINIQTKRAKWKVFKERANGARQMVDRFWNAGWTDKSDDGIEIYAWLKHQAKIAERDADAAKQDYLDLKNRKQEIIESMLTKRREVFDIHNMKLDTESNFVEMD